MGVSTAMEVIEAYSGLSPAAFFTIAALMVVAYKMVCSMFVDPEEEHSKKSITNDDRKTNPIVNNKQPPQAIQDPVRLGDMTEQELRAFDGSDPSKPLLMAVKGQIYDVSISRMFYGPGGPYALFAGREASRALALMSFDPRDLTADLEGLSDSELEVLQDWEYKFVEKYGNIGRLIPEENGTIKEVDVDGEEEEEKRQECKKDRET